MSSRAYRFDDEEVDDETFLNNSRRSQSQPDTLEERRLQLLEKKREIEQRTVRSTERSLSHLRASEEIGIATAEELARQKEQLERTEKKLDDINTTLRFSQRHIQGIKSVFGTLKNLVGGKPTLPIETKSKTIEKNSPGSESSSRVTDSFPAVKKSPDEHPALRLKQEEPSTDTQLVVDRNLGEMLNSITKLKGLACDLGDEIETQNELIDNVTYKSEIANSSLTKQNKEMKKLLK